MLSNMKSFARRSIVAVVAAGAALGVLGAARTANAGLSIVLPRLFFPAGKSYEQLAANWWQWALSQPAASSPLLDATGANCGKGQSGLAWFLAGTLDSTPVKRTCTVPYGKTIVFPIVNSGYFAFASDPPEQKTEAFIRSQVVNAESATNLRAEVDGIVVYNPSLYLEKSVVFGVTLPADNIYGLPAGFRLEPSVDEGYYLAVQPLLPGRHSIHFHGEMPGGFVTDVTYDLQVR
jgi:hypothetical protein